MIGFASDGANVMMGSNNSVASRFKEKIPHIFIMKCYVIVSICVHYMLV